MTAIASRPADIGIGYREIQMLGLITANEPSHRGNAFHVGKGLEFSCGDRSQRGNVVLSVIESTPIEGVAPEG